MKKIIITLCLTLFFVSHLSAKETITWQVVHWPPFQMLEGPDKGNGRFDAMLKLYMANLPQYAHKTINMNWSRFWSGVKEGKKICNMFAIKTKERAAYAVFSKPLSVGLPLSIMMRDSSVKSLGSRDPISIVTLLRDNRFKGVFIDKRSYYTVMDAILAENASLSTIERLAIPEESIIQMILTGRADYTLEYPYVAHYMAGKIQTGTNARIESIEIKELQELGQSCLACPDNAWGRKVIADFDNMLNQLKTTPEYLNIQQMYHTDPKELEAIRQGFVKIILESTE